MRAALLVLLVAVFLMPPVAAAQPAPCVPCTQGDALIDRYKLAEIRPLAAELAKLQLAEVLTTQQYETVVNLRNRQPVLGRLGALDDAELALIATALCRDPDNHCTAATTRALTCLADRCDVALPPDPIDDVLVPRDCKPRPRRRSSPMGVAIDWGNGWQRAGAPNDGRLWSLGFEGRMSMGGRTGIVARVDRSAGRDEATDVDDNGRDDMSTGSITRFTALAGPSYVLHAARFQKTTRFLRLDLLAGYTATRSQSDEAGIVGGLDLGYQVAALRLGVRALQGVGDAASATMVLAHVGISVGSVPYTTDERHCRVKDPGSRLAIGFELPLGGGGFSKQLGYMATGLGLELYWFLHRRIDAVAHGDLLLFPGNDRDRMIHQAVLGGFRFDHGPKRTRRKSTGWFSTVMMGYTHGAGFDVNTVGTGPIVDLSIAWGGQDKESAGWLRMHGRLGFGADNSDYLAFFLSAGFELRLDPQRWRRRVRRYY